MKVFLVLVLIALMIAVVVTLVRGIVQFLKNASTEAREGAGPSEAALRSNQLMQKRILFQGAAILVAALLLYSVKGS